MGNINKEIDAIYSNFYTLKMVKDSVESLFKGKCPIISFNSKTFDFIVGLSSNTILEGKWKSNHYHILFKLKTKEESKTIGSLDLMIEIVRENLAIIDILIMKSKEIEESLLRESKVQKTLELLIKIIQSTLSDHGITDFDIIPRKGYRQQVVVKKKLIANCTLNAFMNWDNYNSQIQSMVDTLVRMPNDFHQKSWEENDLVPNFFCKKAISTDGTGLLPEKGLRMNYHGLYPDISFTNINNNSNDTLLKKLSTLGFYFKVVNDDLMILLSDNFCLRRCGNKTWFNGTDYVFISTPDMLKLVSMIAMVSQFGPFDNRTRKRSRDFAYGLEPILIRLLPKGFSYYITEDWRGLASIFIGVTDKAYFHFDTNLQHNITPKFIANLWNILKRADDLLSIFNNCLYGERNNDTDLRIRFNEPEGLIMRGIASSYYIEDQKD